MIPRFITFTGADDQTNLDDMVLLSYRYPLEFGILISTKKMGKARYPSMKFFEKLSTRQTHLNLSLHVCGDLSEEISNTGNSKTIENIFNLIKFKRMQINIGNNANKKNIFDFSRKIKVNTILQTREEFPSDRRFEWLYDCSGGKGVEPNKWANHPGDGWFVGYAGGLNPKNVAAIVSNLHRSEQDYWIDMETGIRTDDEFDITKCKEVCRSIYGSSNQQI